MSPSSLINSAESRVLSSLSNSAILGGVGSLWRHCSISRTLWASEPESCPTKGRKRVVNRTFVGVVWTIERLLMRGMMVAEYFHHATKGGLLQATEGAQA